MPYKNARSGPTGAGGSAPIGSSVGAAGGVGAASESHDNFIVKDSGNRTEYVSGMVRDIQEDKLNYIMLRDGPMYKRWMHHKHKGDKKYGIRNWMKAKGQAELDGAWASFSRHVEDYIDGKTDEDHAAAIFFNINLIEYIKERMKNDAST